MVNNIQETTKVPASFLVDGFRELSPVIKEALLLHAKAQSQSPETISDEAIEAIATQLPEKMRIDLSKVGATLPIDMVELSVRLGDFMYHAYAFNLVKPEAPLAIKRLEKRLMEIADILDKDEFIVPEDVINMAESVLMDEDKWAKTPFGATLMVAGQPKYISLTSSGINIAFPKIIQAAVDVCEAVHVK